MHIALQTTLKVISELKTIEHLKKGLAYGLDITIVGDNDFYSQQEQVSSQFCSVYVLSGSNLLIVKEDGATTDT